MNRAVLLALAIGLSAFVSGSSWVSAQAESRTVFEFGFERGPEGWEVGFADLPVDFEQSIFDLDSGHRRLPDGLGSGGIYVQGHNRSDDLFMFLKRRIDGLRPDSMYSVTATVDLATNIGGGSFGIGGSPGGSVFVKAGATTEEPEPAADASGHLRMNVDKGNQAQGGESMVVIGDLAHPDVVSGEYRIKTMDSARSPLSVRTDREGGMWLIVGTDSGFEGLTTIYYAGIAYTLVGEGLPNTGDAIPDRGMLAVGLALGVALVAVGAATLRSGPDRRIGRVRSRT